MTVKNGDVFYSDDRETFDFETVHYAVERLLAYNEEINKGDIVVIYSGEICDGEPENPGHEFSISNVKEVKVKIINDEYLEFEIIGESNDTSTNT